MLGAPGPAPARDARVLLFHAFVILFNDLPLLGHHHGQPFNEFPILVNDCILLVIFLLPRPDNKLA